MADICDRLRELLLEKGLEQKQGAEMMGLKTTTFNTYVTGQRKPDIKTIIKLADFFDVSIDYLLGRSNEREVMSARFYKENIDLLRGEMIFEQLSQDIAQKLENSSLSLTFTPEYLENLATGKLRPTPQHINCLAVYAGVQSEFFLSPSKLEDLRLARDIYAKQLAEKRIKHLSDKLNEFVNNPDSTKAIELAYEIADKGIDIEKMKDFVAMQNINMFLGTLKKLQQKGVDLSLVTGFKLNVKL